MYSVRGDLKEAGFPHSEISGSKPICRLPAAYRRLPRPSSPVIAKASTTCTYSLDPITLSASVVSNQLAVVSNNNFQPHLPPKHRLQVYFSAWLPPHLAV